MTNFNIDLTPQLINLATEGSLDGSILNGKSYQRTFNMYEVKNGDNRKIINQVNDGNQFNDNIFQDVDGVETFCSLKFDSNKSAENIILSNNDLTATFSAVINNNSFPEAVTNCSIKNGEKAIFSMIIEKAPGAPGNTGIGICNDNFDPNSYLGISYDSIGYYNDGSLYTNDDYYLGELELSGFTDGDTVSMAVDRVNNLIWVKVNDGFWNNDASKNPLSNVGGIDISFLSGNVYPTATLFKDVNSIFGKTTIKSKLVYFK